MLKQSVALKKLPNPLVGTVVIMIFLFFGVISSILREKLLPQSRRPLETPRKGVDQALLFMFIPRCHAPSIAEAVENGAVTV